MAKEFNSDGIVDLSTKTPSFGSISRVIESLHVSDHDTSGVNFTPTEIDLSCSRQIDFTNNLLLLVIDNRSLAVSNDIVFSTLEVHDVQAPESNSSDVASQILVTNQSCGSKASSSRARSNFEHGTSSLQPKQNSGIGFLELSDANWRKVIEDTSDKSIKVNNWARNKFDSWRIFMGMSTEWKIEEIQYPELGGLVAKFLLMCCKCNGERYPSASLMSIFMAFQRILFNVWLTR